MIEAFYTMPKSKGKKVLIVLEEKNIFYYPFMGISKLHSLWKIKNVSLRRRNITNSYQLKHPSRKTFF